MKKSLCCLLSILLLAGCAPKEPDTEATAAEIGNAVVASQPEEFWAALHPLSADQDPEELAVYLSTAYGLPREAWVDGVAGYAEGMGASEMAVLQLADGWDKEEAVQALWDYIDGRLIDFTGYAPEEAALVEDALVLERGRWLLLAICPDPAAADSAFRSFFGEVQQTVRDPGGGSHEKVEMTLYDTSPVVEAYRSGDASALSDMDRAVLEACVKVMEEMLTADMTPAERELAIHDWMIDHTDYDRAEALPNNQHPYGLLLEGQAICIGYANTFQLFMDLLDIPCITVVSDTHAWNQVQLDGEWYGVDVTWDDPMGSYEDVPAAGEPAHHTYFNVTGDFLRETGHKWEADGVPEATGTRYAWQPS